LPVITNRSSAASLHSARHGRCACWAALLSLAAALLVLLLTYRPRLIVPLALGAPPLVLPFLLF